MRFTYTIQLAVGIKLAYFVLRHGCSGPGRSSDIRWPVQSTNQANCRVGLFRSWLIRYPGCILRSWRQHVYNRQYTNLPVLHMANQIARSESLVDVSSVVRNWNSFDVVLTEFSVTGIALLLAHADQSRQMHFTPVGMIARN